MFHGFPLSAALGKDSPWSMRAKFDTSISDFTIKLNHRGILSGLAELSGALGDENVLFVAIDKLDKIGEEKVKTVTYEITVRNTKSTASSFYLQDQIPVSQNKELVILLVESSGATLDENSGLLNWKLNIKPKETKKITFTYSVKYPKTKIVAGL